eukprot:scaffold17017_cov79-Isochrysis_galbana.AAC.3
MTRADRHHISRRATHRRTRRRQSAARNRSRQAAAAAAGTKHATETGEAGRRREGPVQPAPQ